MGDISQSIKNRIYEHKMDITIDDVKTAIAKHNLEINEKK